MIALLMLLVACDETADPVGAAPDLPPVVEFFTADCTDAEELHQWDVQESAMWQALICVSGAQCFTASGRAYSLVRAEGLDDGLQRLSVQCGSPDAGDSVRLHVMSPG